MYKLSTDYAKLLQFLIAGNDAAGFVTTNDYMNGDVVGITRRGPYNIHIGVRGYSHASVYPFNAEDGTEEEVFIKACTFSGLKWIEPGRNTAMKEHELRELVNKLTDSACTYAGTQQLREQLSGVVSTSLSQYLPEWMVETLKITDPVAESEEKEPVKRQYYWQKSHCQARSPFEPGCICWWDEGTGPFSDGVEIVKLTWRDKPAEKDFGCNE